jgi:hypothetical protein
MSKLREAAGMLVEHGKALGRLEHARLTVEQLTRESAAAAERGKPDDAAVIIALAHATAARFGDHEHAATAALTRARELMAELEHPGAVLARRLVATARAARAAWNGSR